MSVFNRTPLARIADDLKYFWDCCVVKKSREERYKEIEIELCKCPYIHCQYWFTRPEMRNKYKELRRTHPILSAELRYAYYLYLLFEKEFGFREHEDWCIYDIHGYKLRDGVKNLGMTLHALCHGPIDLIYNRAVGLRIFQKCKHGDIDLKNVENHKDDEGEKENVCEMNAECTEDELNKVDEVEKILKNESKDAQDSRLILRSEQFLSDYFEIMSLKAIISGEIKLREGQTTTLKGWMGVFSSILLSLWISSLSAAIQDSIFGKALFSFWFLTIKVSSLIFGIMGLLLIAAIIWHIWISIKLNEAKDVMYICLGVDYDDPEALIVSD